MHRKKQYGKLSRMDFKSYLAICANQIDQQLDLILSDFLNQTKKTHIKLLPLALGFINACKGGKRIRGTLVKLGYEIGGGIPDEEIVRVGAAFEILHAAILIHDDIIDQSPLRRGQPSLYKALGGGHYGISQAIGLGDIGLYLPIQIIATSQFPDEFKNKALSYLSKTIVNTGWGQILDMELPIKKGRLEEDAKFINLFKTAKYTIAGPLQLGAILAGAEQELIRVFGEFGESLGIAFQIQDDILDGETESVESAQAEALEYVTKAKKMIPKITNNPNMSELLKQMVEYLVQRRK